MSEKKTILSVVFGVAIVALIIATVSSIVDSFTLFCDYEDVNINLYQTLLSEYSVAFGVLELIAGICGVAFVILAVAMKKYKNITISILAAFEVLYLIVTVIIMRNVISDMGEISSKNYTAYIAYLTNVLAVTVPMAIVAVSSTALKFAGHYENGNSSVVEQPSGQNIAADNFEKSE